MCRTAKCTAHAVAFVGLLSVNFTFGQLLYSSRHASERCLPLQSASSQQSILCETDRSLAADDHLHFAGTWHDFPDVIAVDTPAIAIATSRWLRSTG